MVAGIDEMKHVGLFALALLIATSCQRERVVAPPPSSNAMQHENAALKQELEDLRKKSDLQNTYIAETTKTLTEIQDNLAVIAEREHAIKQASDAAVERGTPLSPSQRDSMLKDLAGLSQQLEQQKALIASFQEKEGQWHGKIDSLSELVMRFEKTIATKDGEIVDLRKTIERMTLRVSDLEEGQRRDQRALQERDLAIENRDAQVRKLTGILRTGYILAGPAARLVSLGVVKESGGFLRRRKRTLALDFDTTPFTLVDISETVEIDLAAPADKIEVVSPHPRESYRIVPQDRNSSKLVVQSPDSFWRFRYVVICYK